MRVVKFISLAVVSASISFLSFMVIFYIVLNKTSLNELQMKLSEWKLYMPRPFIVDSGSMAPAIKAGSIVFVIRSNDFTANDIISFTTDAAGKDIITHRIVTKQFSKTTNAEEVFITKGDANEEADKKTVRKSQIAGKIWFVLPYFGRLAIFAKSPYGFILFIIIPATIVVYEELKFLGSEIKRIFKKRVGRFGNRQDKLFTSSTNHKGVPKIVIIIPVIAAGLVFISVTKAFFSDTEHSELNSFSAGIYSSPAPTLITSPSPTAEVIVEETANDTEP